VKKLMLSDAKKLIGQIGCLQDNSPTNQLAVSQVAGWITR